MKTFMFPGQGSQAKGMGGSLFDELPRMTETADRILGYSIKELCLEDPRNQLNRTEFTQPALYVVNALSCYKKLADSGSRPDYLAGHSLGEFNALLAAECFDFETGLRLVQKRGEVMSRAPAGAMAAVVNVTKQEIEGILASHELNGIDLANDNTPSQIVISGPPDEIVRAESVFQQGKMLYYPLNTSGAFHSRSMRAAQEEFGRYLAGFQLAELKIPVMANATARPYRNEAILETLTSQVASTVRWCESVQYLLAVATERGETMLFDEVGYGEVLTKLSKTIQRQTPDAVLNAIVEENRQARQLGDSTLQETAAPAPERDDRAGRPVAVGEKIAAWNQRYPVGTRVKSSIADYAELETRTQAVVLFGHRAAIYMKGYNGYFDLDEVVPV